MLKFSCASRVINKKMKRNVLIVSSLILTITVWFILYVKVNNGLLRNTMKVTDRVQKVFVSFNGTFGNGEILSSKYVSDIHRLSGNSNKIINISVMHGTNRNQPSKKQPLRHIAHKSSRGYKSCSRNSPPAEGIHQMEYPYFKASFPINREPIKIWISSGQIRNFCGGKLKIFDGRFALLNDVILDISKRFNAEGKPKGGETLKKALGQEERDEFFEFSKGFWKIRCDSGDIPSQSRFQWVKYLEKMTKDTNELNKTTDEIIVETKVTLAVTREDYCNLHNFIRQMYNAFLLMMIFNKQPQDVSVVFVDAHPVGVLDQPWEDIFGPVTRAGNLSRPVLYKKLIWGLREGDGGLTNFESKHLAYGEEFRAFFLQQYHINDSVSKDCNQITITINLRRDKVFHPRNEKGMVGRKIFNEAEIIGDIINAFPNACVEGVLMDSLPMRQQLEVISTTDIFIGMHGAGMTHSIFLPKHAAVLELFPKDFKRDRPWYVCYQKIAEWRGLKYDSWENFDDSNEMPYDYTILPRTVIIEKTKQLVNELCKT